MNTAVSQVNGDHGQYESGRFGDGKIWARQKLEELNTEEKVLLLTGSDLWRTNAIPRVGISKMKTSDGPIGVRGGIFTDGAKTASLPSGVSLAAMWDCEAIARLCSVLISEAKDKEVDVILGPTVCIPRTPLGGRNFEAYSEDPLLTGKLAARFINEIQAAGIGACIKHFAANDQEDRRFFVDAKIPERALREIHLQPFQIAIRESNPWTVMTAYNKVNGEFCSAHRRLLTDILRGEWQWDGATMSDWFGTNSVVPSVEAGLDLEMPGPVRRRGKWLLDALQRGAIDESFVDKSVIRILELLHKTGKSQVPDWREGKEKSSDKPEHRQILREAAADGIVVLKNEQSMLPLTGLDGKSVAILGPNAMKSVQTGGGSSNLEPHYRTTPYESIKTAISDLAPSATIRAASGILTHRYLPLVDPQIMHDPVTGESGFRLELWRNMEHQGEPFIAEHRPSSNLICYDGLPPELTMGERYSYRGRSVITPRTSGTHQFSLSSCGPGKIYLNGQCIIDIERRWWSPKSALFMSYGSPEKRVSVNMEAGKEYEFELESISREPKPQTITDRGMLEREEVQDGGRIGFLENPGDLKAKFDEAVQIAKSSDIALVVVGKDPDWETESSDMVSMDLPGNSNALVHAIAAVNPNTIVVNQTGSPITMPWVNEVRAIVQAWYQGQEHGNAMADVLLGTVNPSGKLPITFPRRIEDNPSFDDYPGDNDVVHYGEYIHAGYRFYDHRKIEPLFPFGFGLSYTTFEYSNMRISSNVLEWTSNDHRVIDVMVDVTNTGIRDGREIVQFYVSQVSKPGLSRPIRELKAWDKAIIAAGATVTVKATLDRTSFSYWNDAMDKWVVDADAEFCITAAKHSRDAGLTATLKTVGCLGWIH